MAEADGEARPWSTPVSRLFLMWFLLGFCFVVLGYFNPYRVPKDYLKEFIAFKLALIGLFAAITTFQWGWWQQFAQRTFEELHDPHWRGLWVSMPADSRAHDPNRRRDVARWLRWRRSGARSVLKGVFRATQWVLATLASTIYLLIVSVLVDLLAILDGTNRATHMISLGTFGAAMFAGISLWGVHTYGLEVDHVNWERSFRQATRGRPKG